MSTAQISHISRTWRAARAYAERLHFAVFPLAPRSKVPLVAGGHGCKDATTDVAQIDAWWRAHPEANVGIATGKPSGVWMLDVDPRNGGDAALDAFQEQHGALPTTVEALTGGGGRHLVFRYTPALDAVRWLPLAPGADCKGTGGHVI